jgi:transketolase
MLVMARGPGQGYVGQGLGIADLMAALYFHEMRWDPEDVTDAARDRFRDVHRPLFHRALGRAGRGWGLPAFDELGTYGADDSRLQMSTLDTTPGVEIIGGSLGHGLGSGGGHGAGPPAAGLRRRGSSASSPTASFRRAPRGRRRCRHRASALATWSR